MVALREWFDQLANREKLLLFGGSILIVGFLFAEFLILPKVDRLAQLDRLIPEKEKELQSFGRLSQIYQEGREQLDHINGKLQKQPPHFSLISYIEKLTITKRLQDSIVGLRPQVSAPFEGFQETTVEVVLEALTLSQTVSLIQELEDSPYHIQIKQFSMKSRFSDPSLLDVRIVVSGYASSPAKQSPQR